MERRSETDSAVRTSRGSERLQRECEVGQGSGGEVEKGAKGEKREVEEEVEEDIEKGEVDEEKEKVKKEVDEEEELRGRGSHESGPRCPNIFTRRSAETVSTISARLPLANARDPLWRLCKAIASRLFNSPFAKYLFVLRRVRHTKP